ncbi:hypothetical protein CAEBREN_09029 [Caenorhabditis brenneri]|uniref:Uncharacterized protein n=1 Tax=Caenorhabditis brenneri TaxID=135651 RepID=G0NG13_CAEBE|nr:hypothetical protein CAEBREN_09029 [Caenorhabditis brenneri]
MMEQWVYVDLDGVRELNSERDRKGGKRPEKVHVWIFLDETKLVSLIIYPSVLIGMSSFL